MSISPKSKSGVMSFLLFAVVVLCNMGYVNAETGPSEPFNPAWTPQVVYDDNPGLVEFYWKAWQLAWDHVHTDTTAPTSPFMDEAFSNGDIWIWDTCFMGLFCKYAPDRFPGVQSLENFYKVLLDGQTSTQTIWHPDNPPLFAWVEWQNYKFTNDKARLRWLLEDKQYLQKQFAFFENSYLGQSIPGAQNSMQLERSSDGVGYSWRDISSGMDNSPRERSFQVYWVDAISQQALSAYYISKMAEEIGNTAIRDEYLAKYNSLVNLINTYYWDSQDNFYYDIRESTHEFNHVKTMASYWPLLARAASSSQAQYMANYASDPQIFGGMVAFPSLSRNDQDFDPKGRYWCGGVWLPTAYMGVKSLENYGFQEEADASTRSIVDHVYNTYTSFSPATIWECYSPTEAKPATLVSGSGQARPDFCGWSALGPISLMIENYLGFHTVDAQANRVEWHKYQTGRHGIRNLKFGNITTHIIGNSDSVTVWSSGAYTLSVNGTDYAITAGTQSWGPNPPTLEGTPGTWPEMKVNLALNKTATMNPGAGWGHVPEYAIDGDLSSYAQSETPVWDLMVDLEDVNEINTITFVPDADSWASAFTIQVSTDNVNWQTVVTETSGSNTGKTYTFATVKARYILLDVTAVGHTGNWGHAVREFEVYHLNDTNDIAVENYSFEQPGSGKQTNWSTVPGWNSDTLATDSGVETGATPTEGSYTGYLMGSDPSVWNLTGHVIGSGENYDLVSDARITSQSNTIVASLYYDDSGSRISLASQEYTLTGSMSQYHLSFSADSVPASNGHLIGIEFDNPSNGWVGVDNVHLFTSGYKYYDGTMGMSDLLGFVAQWLMSDCTDTPACNGADLNGDMKVSLSDLAEMARNWQIGI